MTHVSDSADVDLDLDLADPAEEGGVAPAVVGAGDTLDDPGLTTTWSGDDRGREGWLARSARRILRRPLNWIDAPWTLERTIKTLTAFSFLVVTAIITLNVVHWDLITTSNTPTGGDMGAHVMGPAYLRDHLLSNFRLNGWNPYWYDGFPMYRFYMVIPALMIVALNIVLPYGIAFKLIVVLGIMTLPVCCWAFGRLGRFMFPIPELFSVAALIFLLEDTKDLSILGGTIKSTMAGEFSFSIALSLAILGLGLFARGLETGQYRARTAVILALAVLSHGIVAIFVLIAVSLMALVWMDKARFKYCLTTIVPMGLLTAFWIIPFASGSAFMTDMKYEARPSGANDSYWKMFFNLDITLDRIVFVFALIGFVAAVKRRQLSGAWIGLCIVALALLARFTQHEHTNIPLIGLLWNPRILPFVNLLRYMLMMVGIVEVGRGVVWLVSRARVGYAVAVERRQGRTGAAVALPTSKATTIGGALTAVFTLIVVLLMLAVTFEVDFFASSRTASGRYALSLGVGSNKLVLYQKRASGTRGLADSWAMYNFTGYEGKGAYGEYKALVDTMASIGKDPNNGCGRALWENNGDNGRYGTTMALMLLPHWTDGCIGSSEGLFFEASGTTPYHFIAAAAMSTNSSNPVRQLRYADSDAAVGVPYLQKLGIRYYLAWTDQAVAKADRSSELEPISVSGPWHIYKVRNSDIVVPLTVQPVVVSERTNTRETWLELGTSWFQNPGDWAAIPAGDGPKDWQRIDVAVDKTRVKKDRVDVVTPQRAIVPKALPKVTVSNIVMGNETVSFDVDQIRVPVLVKVSYFPNWEATGADGPYRIAPNLMVVVPTSNHVTMEFTRTTTDYIAYLLTLLGIILLFVFKKFVPITFRSAHPFEFVPSADTARRDPSDPTPADGLTRPADGLTPPALGPIRPGPPGADARVLDDSEPPR